MVCKKCSSEIPENSSYCINCGVDAPGITLPNLAQVTAFTKNPGRFIKEKYAIVESYALRIIMAIMFLVMAGLTFLPIFSAPKIMPGLSLPDAYAESYIEDFNIQVSMANIFLAATVPSDYTNDKFNADVTEEINNLKATTRIAMQNGQELSLRQQSEVSLAFYKINFAKLFFTKEAKQQNPSVTILLVLMAVLNLMIGLASLTFSILIVLHIFGKIKNLKFLNIAFLITLAPAILMLMMFSQSAFIEFYVSAAPISPIISLTGVFILAGNAFIPHKNQENTITDVARVKPRISVLLTRLGAIALVCTMLGLLCSGFISIRADYNLKNDNSIINTAELDIKGLDGLDIFDFDAYYMLQQNKQDDPFYIDPADRYNELKQYISEVGSKNKSLSKGLSNLFVSDQIDSGRLLICVPFVFGGLALSLIFVLMLLLHNITNFKNRLCFVPLIIGALCLAATITAAALIGAANAGFNSTYPAQIFASMGAGLVALMVFESIFVLSGIASFVWNFVKTKKMPTVSEQPAAQQ